MPAQQPNSPLRMYSTPWCSDCHRASAFLGAHGIAVEKIDIDQDPQAAATVMAANDGKRRVPTFEIDGRFYGNPPLAQLRQLLRLGAEEDAGTVEHRALVVIGTGPAGLTAALYAARAELQPLVLRGAQPGGQLTTTTEVENYPGFPEAITGPELIERLEQQAERFGAELRYGTVTGLDLSPAPGQPFRLRVDEETPILADAVIVSTGASAKYLGLDNEKRLLGRGVSACATCDGAFFRGKAVAVVGGGDTAVEETLFLTRFTDRVTLIHRRGELRASKALQERLRKHEERGQIRVLWHRRVVDIVGGEQVEGLILQDPRDGRTEPLPVDGVFIAIGHTPNTRLLSGYLPLDPQGYVRTEPGSSRTAIPGVFASGDVQDPVYRQAITAAGSGCMAALDAERYLAERESTPVAEPADLKATARLVAVG